eukprot:CAMPEP_0117514548 /NCGR_PEP_ID=MMETSP0784-20121206/30126_1 /TAXON_ID=39447 /ORGANISM="" /LENGTH=541 /DNA_ID=CAMNT_0005310347 /DNA_START=13 /DNA_END=1634 /DNA_ORIENTATION=+
MAFLRLVTKSLETAAHGVATGAVTLADELTGRQVPELRNARQDQERRLHAASRGVEQNARIVGGDLERVVGTTGVSLLVLGRVVSQPDQLQRLVELIETYDLPSFVRALATRSQLPPDFFPAWVRRAGGYFPKFAQVLSVRADLIRDPEVLAQFARCLEDMPSRSREVVREHVMRRGWDERMCDGVGEALNAGTVAQVNTLTMPDGSPAVVKVAWPDTKQQMQTDFRLFEHARGILGALRLEDEQAQSVAGIFSAVQRNEPAVLQEFDLGAEADAMRMAATICGGDDWGGAYRTWLIRAQESLAQAPPQLAVLAMTFVTEAQSSRWAVRVPLPFDGYCNESVLVMSHASGVSMHQLLSGAEGEAGQSEAATVLLGLALPLIGWLLLCKSSSHLAHVDPHPGNFRWDNGSRTLWVLDWGSNVKLASEHRVALCLLITLIAEGSSDDAIADTARSFGIRSDNDHRLAVLMRGMLNASGGYAAQDALNTAAMDSILNDVGDEIVPVVRCLATLGGILQGLQRKLRDQRQQDVPLSLAALWAPFA